MAEVKVTRVDVGDEYTAQATPTGFYRAQVHEPGYVVEIKYGGTAFVSDDDLLAADMGRGSFRSRRRDAEGLGTGLLMWPIRWLNRRLLGV